MHRDWQHRCLTGFTRICETHPPVPVTQSWAQRFSHVLSSHSKSLLFQRVCSIYSCREELSVISLPRVRTWPPHTFPCYTPPSPKQACVYVYVCPHGEREWPLTKSLYRKGWNWKNGIIIPVVNLVQVQHTVHTQWALGWHANDALWAADLLVPFRGKPLTVNWWIIHWQYVEYKEEHLCLGKLLQWNTIRISSLLHI